MDCKILSGLGIKSKALKVSAYTQNDLEEDPINQNHVKLYKGFPGLEEWGVREDK